MTTPKKFTLITGASKGIGKAMAEVCAQRKMNLVLVARSKELLQEIANGLAKQYGIEVYVIAADLLEKDSHKTIFAETDRMELDVNFLVNNAGMGNYGKFHSVSLESQLATMQLNMDVMVRFAHEFINRRMGKDRSYLLNTVSTAAYQAVPNTAIYAATKSFMLSFGRAVRHELSGTNISITSLCPGATESEFFGPAGLEAIVEKNKKYMMSALDVAEVGIDGALKGKSVVIPGVLNNIGAFMSLASPPNLTAYFAGKIFEE